MPENIISPTSAPQTTPAPANAAPDGLPQDPRSQRINKAISFYSFVIRCVVAAVIAYWLSKLLGMHQPVWAAIAAVHIAREPLTKTHKQTVQRVAGTIFGSLVGLGVIGLADIMPMNQEMMIAVAVAVCSAISFYRPLLHISIWVCLSVMLKSNSTDPQIIVGFWRMIEVIFGALIAVGVHGLTVVIVRWIRAKLKVTAGQDVLDDD